MADNNVTRRRALQALGVAGFAGLAGCGEETGPGGDDDGNGNGETDPMTTEGTRTPQDVSGTIKIGVLQPLTGDLRYYGQQSVWGFLSGLAYKGDSEPPGDISAGTITMDVGDVTYELLLRDTEFTADIAQTRATDLVQSENVDMLFGCSSSGAATRVIDTVVSATNVPYMAGPAASADITSNNETCRDIVFRASENTAMDARSGGQYVAEETDVENVYLFGADYSFGRAVVNNYEQVLAANGVNVIDTRFVERGYSDWGPLLDNAEEAGADGIVGGFTVATLPQLFTAFLTGDYSFRAFGGFATLITNTVVGETMQNALGEDLTAQDIRDAKLGPFTTRYHWNQYDNPINDAFVDTYTSTYGMVPDLFTSGTFTAASAIHQAARYGGSLEGADIASELRGMTVRDTPKGENGYTFQTYNNQIRSEMTVADPIPTTDEWADAWSATIMPGEPRVRISGEDATIPESDVSCSL
ncbi:ABC transporter substrate-binding protein [Halapricum salinum]|uniref:ABC transporter substrate-binding protein n=1 Tax=Halapricum salinum TaxID=1457250 RepID=A0A4D6HFF2_9EURY|nr:ABC transporter substrate-binding protein [Halapricum salinum]QCC52749.1 ABC transporter substrate-binding protein [Halapricum salinum]